MTVGIAPLDHPDAETKPEHARHRLEAPHGGVAVGALEPREARVLTDALARNRRSRRSVGRT